MTFFEENYIYIIIIGVVVLMTIIGYVADKKGYGKKDKTEKTKANDKNNVINNIEPVKEDTVDVNIEQPVINDFKMPDDIAPVEDTFSMNNDNSGLDFNMNDFEQPYTESVPVYQGPVVEPSTEPVTDDTKSKENNVSELPANETKEEPMEDIFGSYDIFEQKDNQEVASSKEPIISETNNEQPIENNVFENVNEQPIDNNTFDNNNEQIVDNNIFENSNVEQPVDNNASVNNEEQVVGDSSESNNDNFMEDTKAENTFNVDDGNSFDDVIPFPEQPQIEEEKPVETVAENENITPEEDFTLPSIENLNQELQEVNNNDDDIWKF